jgi:hypothetical protein
MLRQVQLMTLFDPKWKVLIEIEEVQINILPSKLEVFETAENDLTN